MLNGSCTMRRTRALSNIRLRKHPPVSCYHEMWILPFTSKLQVIQSNSHT
ncbi:hypothetical protein V12B01_13340 [Vibrio splendidus 12B01]|nr:hypothetical protein V12B01_13340 [Vibrio splendidus 12B01]